eukprot:scaffold2446_cov227-Alexandrium_tamarense.AAC.2
MHMHKIRYMEGSMHFTDMQARHLQGRRHTPTTRIRQFSYSQPSDHLWWEEIEREQTEQGKLVRRYTRKAERRHEWKRIGAASLKHVHAGAVTLLALVGSDVIGLAVGAWLGLFVEGD